MCGEIKEGTLLKLQSFAFEVEEEAKSLEKKIGLKIRVEANQISSMAPKPTHVL